MRKILVTGGSGLVGRHLSEVLPEATYVSSKDFDLTSEADVRNLCSERWEHIVHLAAKVGGILPNIRFPAEFIEENLLMNSLLLRHARLSGTQRLTAILSTCIYPDVADSYPMSEEDLHSGPPQSTNFAYAIAKRAMAAQIDAYRTQYGLRYNYLIPCNLYGPHDRVDLESSHFLTALIAKIVIAQKEGSGHVDLFGTGRPLRQFMYAGDLAVAIKACIEEEIDESFNVAPEQALSIRELAEIALRACGADHLELRFDETKPDGQFRKDVSNSRMMAVLPGFAFTPLEVGIKLVHDRYSSEIRI